MKPGRPFVSIDPAIHSGVPCLNHTRLPVNTVAGVYHQHGLDEIQRGWDVTRPDVLVACWYVGIYGVEDFTTRDDGTVRLHRGPKPGWRAIYGAWAVENGAPLWSGAYDLVPDPPTKGEA